jgi:hypothetical protein
MSEHDNPINSDELYELYAELHLTCERAAAALRLNSQWDAAQDELLEHFHKEEARAEAIWQRIKALQTRG